MDRINRNYWGNCDSLHTMGQTARELLRNAELSILEWLNRKQDRIEFCSSGSEAMFFLLKSLSGVAKNVITTKIEHSSVLLNIEKLYSGKSKFIEILENGKIDFDSLKYHLENLDSSFVVISPVNHETGIIQDVDRVYSLVKEHGSILLLDGVQAASRLLPAEWSNKCDLLTISSHKLYGPKGSAAIVYSDKIKLQSNRGSNNPNDNFPGTKNLTGIGGFASAIELQSKMQNDDLKRMNFLIKELLFLLDKENLNYHVESLGTIAPGIINISFSGINDIEELFLNLANENICISRFSACSASIAGESKILKEMKVPESRCLTSVRVSLGRFSIRKDIFDFVKTLKRYMDC